MSDFGQNSTMGVLFFLVFLAGFGLLAIAEDANIVEIVLPPAAPTVLPPTVSIVSPLALQVLDGSVVIITSISSSEPISGAWFSISSNGTPITDQNLDSALNYSSAWDSIASPDGTYDLLVGACNSGGCASSIVSFSIAHVVVVPPTPTIPSPSTVTVTPSNVSSILSLTDSAGALVGTGSALIVPLGTYAASIAFSGGSIATISLNDLVLDQNLELIQWNELKPSSNPPPNGDAWIQWIDWKSNAVFSGGLVSFSLPNPATSWFYCDSFDETVGDCVGSWVPGIGPNELSFKSGKAIGFSAPIQPPTISIVSPKSGSVWNDFLPIESAILTTQPLSSVGYAVSSGGTMVHDENWPTNNSTSNYSIDWNRDGFPDGAYDLNVVACNLAGCASQSTSFLFQTKSIVPNVLVRGSDVNSTVSLRDSAGNLLGTDSTLSVQPGIYSGEIQFPRGLMDSVSLSDVVVDHDVNLLNLNDSVQRVQPSPNGNSWIQIVSISPNALFSNGTIAFHAPTNADAWFFCDIFDASIGTCSGTWAEGNVSTIAPISFHSTAAIGFSGTIDAPQVNILNPLDGDIVRQVVPIVAEIVSSESLISGSAEISSDGIVFWSQPLDENILSAKYVFMGWDSATVPKGDYNLLLGACHEFSCHSSMVSFSVNQKSFTRKNKFGFGNGSLPNFDRIVECQRCGQHKAPPETDINMIVSVSNVDLNDSNRLVDYFPLGWVIVDPGTGTVSDYNSEFRTISWDLDENDFVNGTVQVSYWIRSPPLTSPPTKYDFFTEFGVLSSDYWFIIVADPFNPTNVLYFRKRTEFIPTPPLSDGNSNGGSSDTNMQFGNSPLRRLGMSDTNTNGFADFNTSTAINCATCLWHLLQFNSPPMVANQTINSGAWSVVQYMYESSTVNMEGALIANVHVWGATDTNLATLVRFKKSTRGITTAGATSACTQANYQDTNSTASNAYTTKRGDKLLIDIAVDKNGSNTSRTISTCWGNDANKSRLVMPQLIQFAGDFNSGIRFPSNNSLIKSVGTAFDVNAQTRCLLDGNYNCGKAILTLQYCKIAVGQCTVGRYYDMNAQSGDLVLYGGGTIGSGLKDTNQNSGNTLLTPGDTFISDVWRVVGNTDGNYTLRVQSDGNLTYDINHSGKSNSDVNIIIGGHAKFTVVNPSADDNTSIARNASFRVDGKVNCVDGNCNQTSTSLQYCIKSAAADSNAFYDYNLVGSSGTDPRHEITADANSTQFSPFQRNFPNKEVSDANYTRISTDNADWLGLTQAGSSDSAVRLRVDINQNLTDIQDINFQFNGFYRNASTTNDATLDFNVWNEGLRKYVNLVSHTGTGAAASDYNFYADVNSGVSDFNNFFDYDQNITFRWGGSSLGAVATDLNSDYVNVRVKALTLDCGAWFDVNSSSGAIQLVSGTNPDVNSAMVKNGVDDVNWVAKVTVAGFYDLRFNSTLTNGDSNKSVNSASEATRTISVVQGGGDLNTGLRSPANNSLIKSVGTTFDVNAQANCLAGADCGKVTFTLQYCKIALGQCTVGRYYDMNAQSGDLLIRTGTGLTDQNINTGKVTVTAGTTVILSDYNRSWLVYGTTDGNYTLRVQADGNTSSGAVNSGSNGSDVNIIIGGHAKFTVNNPGTDANSYSALSNFSVNANILCADGNCNRVSSSLQYCIKTALNDTNQLFDYNLVNIDSTNRNKELGSGVVVSPGTFSGRDVKTPEVTNANYTNASLIDAAYLTVSTTGNSTSLVRLRLDVNQSYEDISDVNFQFTGKYTGTTSTVDGALGFYVWNEGIKTYGAAVATHDATGGAPADYTLSVDVNRARDDINQFFDFDHNVTFRIQGDSLGPVEETSLDVDQISVTVKAITLNCGAWFDVNSSSGAIQLVTGSNPDVNTEVLKNLTDDVNWTIKGTATGFYDLRVTSTLSNGDSNTSVTAASDATRTIQITPFVNDLSFAISYPASGCTQGKGSLDAGVTCDICYLDASTGTGSDSNYANRTQVNCEGQTTSGNSPIPFFSFDNQSSSSSDENWFIDLNANLPATLKLKASYVSSGYQSTCTGYPQPTSGCQDVNADANATIKLKIPFSSSAVDANGWVWADFVNATQGTVDRNVKHGVQE